MTTATSAALRGTLEDFGAEEILQFLVGTKKTGALVLSGDCSGTVWFVDGEVYGADATTSLPLREAVVAAGLVAEEQWDRAWADASDGVPLSNALASHASLDQNDFDRLIESRIVDTVFELIVTSAADFEFRGDEHHPLVGGRNHTVDDLIAASRERLDRWREVATVLPSIAAVVTLAADVPSDAPDLVLSPGDWRIVAHLDGKSVDRRRHAVARCERVRRVRHAAPLGHRGRSTSRLLGSRLRGSRRLLIGRHGRSQEHRRRDRGHRLGRQRRGSSVRASSSEQRSSRRRRSSWSSSWSPPGRCRHS